MMRVFLFSTENKIKNKVLAYDCISEKLVINSFPPLFSRPFYPSYLSPSAAGILLSPS